MFKEIIQKIELDIVKNNFEKKDIIVKENNNNELISKEVKSIIFDALIKKEFKEPKKDNVIVLL